MADSIQIILDIVHDEFSHVSSLREGPARETENVIATSRLFVPRPVTQEYIYLTYKKNAIGTERSRELSRPRRRRRHESEGLEEPKTKRLRYDIESNSFTLLDIAGGGGDGEPRCQRASPQTIGKDHIQWHSSDGDDAAEQWGADIGPTAVRVHHSAAGDTTTTTTTTTPIVAPPQSGTVLVPPSVVQFQPPTDTSNVRPRATSDYVITSFPVDSGNDHRLVISRKSGDDAQPVTSGGQIGKRIVLPPAPAQSAAAAAAAADDVQPSTSGILFPTRGPSTFAPAFSDISSVGAGETTTTDDALDELMREICGDSDSDSARHQATETRARMLKVFEDKTNNQRFPVYVSPPKMCTVCNITLAHIPESSNFYEHKLLQPPCCLRPICLECMQEITQMCYAKSSVGGGKPKIHFLTCVFCHEGPPRSKKRKYTNGPLPSEPAQKAYVALFWLLVIRKWQDDHSTAKNIPWITGARAELCKWLIVRHDTDMPDLLIHIKQSIRNQIWFVADHPIEKRQWFVADNPIEKKH
jgi:hypothetical protein